MSKKFGFGFTHKTKKNQKELMMNKKGFLILLSIIVLLVLSACSRVENDAAPVVYDTIDESVTGVVIADGEVMPEKDLSLVFETSGIVESVLVSEGQQVRAGDPLFRLESNQALNAQLEAAKLEQEEAKQALDDLLLYAGSEKAAVFQAVLNAQEALHQAEAALDDFDKDDYEDDLEAAKEDIADAKQALEDAEDDLEDYIDLDEDNATRKNKENAVEDAEADLNQAERDREKIEIDFDQLQLNQDLAEARLAAAETEYNKFGSGADEDKLVLAEQRLTAAEANVESLQAAIADLELTAPFDGTVVRIDIKEGEFVRAGQTAGWIVDFSAWYVETDDLNELEVVRIQEGDTVRVELDAFPQEVLTGIVVDIKDYAEISHSDVTYPTRILLDKTDLPLRWRMSATVRFEE